MDKLIQKMTTTRDARFEAYRRMKRRKLSSTVSLAMLSLCIICFNIIQLLPDFKIYSDAITAVTIMLSALVLTMSLLVTGLSYSEKEHQYLECAMKLSKLIDYAKTASDASLNVKESQNLKIKILNRYHSILAECPINHIKIDYKRAWLRKTDNRECKSPESTEHSWYIQFWCWLKRRGIWIEWNILDVNFLYWLLAISIPFIAWFSIKLLNEFSTTNC